MKDDLLARELGRSAWDMAQAFLERPDGTPPLGQTSAELLAMRMFLCGLYMSSFGQECAPNLGEYREQLEILARHLGLVNFGEMMAELDEEVVKLFPPKPAPPTPMPPSLERALCSLLGQYMAAMHEPGSELSMSYVDVLTGKEWTPGEMLCFLMDVGNVNMNEAAR